MASIKIERSNEWMNMFRPYGVYIDGEKVGEIGNNSTEEYQVKPGSYKIYTKIDWFKSQVHEVNIEEGNIVGLTLSVYKYSSYISWFIFISIVLVSIICSIFNYDPTLIGASLIGIYGLYTLYAILFGKNNYLSVSKKN